MWTRTPATDRIENTLRAMAAAMWTVPRDEVTLQRVDGSRVGVVLYYSHSTIRLRWEWYGDTEKCNIGTLGILNLALDAYREELNQRATAIQNALAAYYETVQGREAGAGVT